MKELLIAETDELTAEESLGATHYLVEAMNRGRTQGHPWLLISRPKGRSITLGRFQNERSAVSFDAAEKRELPVFRRITGGTASLLGEGFLHLALVVSFKSLPIDCEPRQFLQKYGALWVKAFIDLGLKPRYFGRDLLSIGDSPFGLLSFDIDDKGTGLVETIIALDESIHLPDKELDGYTTQVRESPSRKAYTTVRQEDETLDSDRVVEAVKVAVQENLNLKNRQRPLNALEKERVRSLLKKVQVPRPKEPTSPSYMKRWRSRTIEESIGFVEATVGVTQGRFLKDVSIHGDFMADSVGIALLEEKLRMCPIKRRQIALSIDDVLGAPEHVILGIRRLGSILEAIMDAAKKGVQEAEGS